MKVWAQCFNPRTHKTISVRSFNSKKEATEYYKSVGFEVKKDWFKGCMRNDFGGVIDVFVNLYPQKYMPEYILWQD